MLREWVLARERERLLRLCLAADAEDDGNAGKHCADRLWLPGNSAVCYRLPVPQLIWGMSVQTLANHIAGILRPSPNVTRLDARKKWKAA